jgi:HK97 gp10 family phage protein
MKVSYKLTGVKEIDNCLNAMSAEMQDKTLQSAAAAAAKPLVTKEKLLAPEGPTGNLVDSIGIVKGGFSQVSSGKRDIGSVIVGPRRGRFKGNAAHLVEYGTKKRKNKTGANRGVMPKEPFAATAFEATKSEVLGGYREEVGKALIRVMKRTIKNSK